MENKQDYRNQIKKYQNRLGLMIGFLAVVIVGLVLVGWRWYQAGRGVIPEERGLSLREAEFSQLRERLKVRTTQVELETEIRYGGEVGKQEPFE